jgi:hypothetical protein
MNNARIQIDIILEQHKKGLVEIEEDRKEREKIAEKAYKRRMLWWHIQMVFSLSYQYKQLMQKLRTNR